MKTLHQFIIEQAGDSINGFCILKPEFLDHEQDFYKLLENAGWKIIQKKRMQLDEDQAKELYKMHEKKDFYKDLCKYMSSGECICCTCSKDCQDPIGEMDKVKDRCRHAWGRDEMRNAMHSSDSLENVDREWRLLMK